METNELLMSLATKVYNKTEDEVKSLIYDGETIRDNAFDNLLTLDAARVSKFKADQQTYFDNGYKKAQSEVLGKAEKTFKEKTGFNAEAETFEALIEQYQLEQAKNKKTTLKDEDIKVHPLYLELEKSRVPKEQYEQTRQEFENYKTKIERDKKFDIVKQKAIQVLANEKLREYDPKIKNNLTNLFLKEFEAYDDVNVDGDALILMKDGKRIEDAHGNIIPFESIVKSKITDYFEILKQDPKGSAGNNNPNNNNNTFTVKSDEDFQRLTKEAKTPEERVAIFEAYREWKKSK